MKAASSIANQKTLPALQSVGLAIIVLRGQRVILDAVHSYLRSQIATLKTAACSAIMVASL